MDFDESCKVFYDLLELPKIKDFLGNDKCKIIADKYILATVFLFFRRANLCRSEYNKKNFYLALYLSHEINEDIEDLKDEIVESYLGPNRQYARVYHEKFLKDRFVLLQRMNFDGHVTKPMCDGLIRKSHWAWKRTRDAEHSGVFYKHIKCKKCYFS